MHGDDRFAFVDELDVLADPQHVAVLGHGRKFEIGVRHLLDDLPRVKLRGGVAVVGPDQRHEMEAEQFARLVLHHALGDGIHVREPAGGIAVVNEVLRVFDDVSQPRLAVAPRRLGAAPLGDVAVVHHHRVDVGVVEPADGDDCEVAVLAVLVPHAAFRFDGNAGLPQHVRERGARPFDILRMNQLEPAVSDPFLERVAKRPHRRFAADSDRPARVQQGDSKAAEELLPLVYEELRRLAAQKMAHEVTGHTLQPTALVHEAWLRLVGDEPQRWNGRGHFFAAAAEAMRRILVEAARRKGRHRHGGGRHRQELHPDLAAAPEPDADLVALDDVLTRFAARYPVHARLVELRHFAGLTGDEAATILGISPSTADRHWMFAKAWLKRELRRGENSSDS